MINNNTTAATTYSVEQFVDMRSTDDVTYYNFAVLDHIDGIEYNLTNIIYDYQEEIEECTVVLTLSDLELSKYKYKPWLLAFDLYGSEQAVFLIFALNDILFDREFDFKKVRVILPEFLPTLLGRIASANADFINKNRSDMKKEEKNTDGCVIWST